MNECPICDTKALVPFLKRERVPVHQNLVIRDQRSAVETPCDDLTLAVCEECGFVFNQSFNPAKLRYGESYDNTQTCSAAFEEYLAELARHLTGDKGISNCRVMEVGCGKGLFLRKLVEPSDLGNVGHGFDPSYVGPPTDLDGRLRFERRYFDSTCHDATADVVVCRHVIEHVPEPLTLLRAVRRAVADSPRAQVFFETPCIEWILTNQVLWDFFYEHCSYFTAQSLTTAFELSGFQVNGVRHVFGGQYLWLEATLSQGHRTIAKNPGAVPALARTFAAAESGLKNSYENMLRTLTEKGPGKVALWGAGAKGVTFANLVDPCRRWIACIVDLNPAKQGSFLPGTGHPVVSYTQLPHYDVTTAILTNPNYHAENLALLRQARINVNLVNLMDAR